MHFLVAELKIRDYHNTSTDVRITAATSEASAVWCCPTNFYYRQKFLDLVHVVYIRALYANSGWPHLHDGQDPGDQAENAGNDGHGKRPGKVSCISTVHTEPHQHKYNWNEKKIGVKT